MCLNRASPADIDRRRRKATLRRARTSRRRVAGTLDAATLAPASSRSGPEGKSGSDTRSPTRPDDGRVSPHASGLGERFLEGAPKLRLEMTSTTLVVLSLSGCNLMLAHCRPGPRARLLPRAENRPDDTTGGRTHAYRH